MTDNHPLVDVFKNIINEVLQDEIVEDMYPMEEVMQIQKDGKFKEFTENFTIMAVFKHKKTNKEMILLAKDRVDFNNKFLVISLKNIYQPMSIMPLNKE